VSVVSLAVIAGSVAGIIVVRRPAAAVATDTDPNAVTPLGRFGIIDIGSKSVKYRALDLYLRGEEPDFNIEAKGETTTSLGAKKDVAAFDPKAVKDTVAAVRDHVARIEEKGIPRDKVFVVCSSGVLNALRKDKAVRETNREMLTGEVRAAVDLPLDFIDEEEETRYAIRALVAPKARPDYLVIDIGGGGVRGGYLDEGGSFYGLDLEYGVMSVDAMVRGKVFPPLDPAKPMTPADGRRYAAAGQQLRETKLRPDVRDHTSRKPINAPKQVVLLGGASWALSTYTHPQHVKDNTHPVTSQDVQRFYDLVTSGKQPDEVAAEVAAAAPAGVRKDVEQEVARLHNVYKGTKLVAAADLLLALDAECQFDKRKLVFARRGQDAWMVGYVYKNAKFQQ
jgi:hypothetical protein